MAFQARLGCTAKPLAASGSLQKMLHNYTVSEHHTRHVHMDDAGARMKKVHTMHTRAQKLGPHIYSVSDTGLEGGEVCVLTIDHIPP
jgi:hypothetical protein